MARIEGLELGNKGMLSAAFGEVSAAKLDINPIQLTQDKTPNMQLAEANGPSTRIEYNKNLKMYLPIDPDSGLMVVHAGPDRQGFRTTPLGPGKGYSG